MPAYHHYQILKKEQQLENPQDIGACLTCKHWDVPELRHEVHVPSVSRCLHPSLKQFQLIVSGASACSLWAEYSQNAPDANAYAGRSEAS